MGAPVINISELTERLDNDFELFAELTELFFDDSASLMDKIKNSIDNNDHESLRKAAHTLKGAVANFAAPGAYEASSVLEMTGRNMELTGAEEQYNTLKSEIDSVVAEMKRMIANGSF